MMIIDIICEKG